MSGEGFSLKGSSDEFSQKCKDLFDFSAIKKSDCSFAQDQKNKDQNKVGSAGSKNDDSDGTFKVPSLPPALTSPNAAKKRPDRDIYRPTKKTSETPNCNTYKFQRNRGRGGGGRFNDRTPDHKKNPQNYTKYSLKDVDTSPKANSEAAFSFLREIEERKRKSELDAEGGVFDTSDNQKGKITFKKKTNKKPKEENQEKPSEEEDKEKLVEEKPTQEKPDEEKSEAKSEEEKKPAEKTSKKKKNKKITLSHLMDEGED